MTEETKISPEATKAGITRRDLLKGGAGAGLAALGLGGTAATIAAASRVESPPAPLQPPRTETTGTSPENTEIIEGAVSLGVYKYETKQGELSVPGIEIDLEKMKLIGTENPELHITVVQGELCVAMLDITDMGEFNEKYHRPVNSESLPPASVVIPISDNTDVARTLDMEGIQSLHPMGDFESYNSKQVILVGGDTGDKMLTNSLATEYGSNFRQTHTALHDFSEFVHQNQPQEEKPESTEQDPFSKEFVTERDLMGENPSSVDLLDEGGISYFTVKSEGRGFEGLGETHEQGDTFWFYGEPSDDPFKGQNISFQVKHVQSTEEPLRSYLAISFDDASGPSGRDGDDEPSPYFPKKITVVAGDKVISIDEEEYKKWDTDDPLRQGKGMFFIPISDARLADAAGQPKNLVPAAEDGLEHIDKIELILDEGQDGRELRFTATKNESLGRSHELTGEAKLLTALDGEVTKEHKSGVSVFTEKTVWEEDHNTRAMKEVEPENDRSCAKYIKTTQGMAILLELDTQHMIGQSFDSLKVNYFSGYGGQELNQYVPVEQLAQWIRTLKSSQADSEAAPILPILLTTYDIEGAYDNVFKVPAGWIPENPPMATGSLEISGVTNVGWVNDDLSAGIGEDRSFKISMFDVAGTGPSS